MKLLQFIFLLIRRGSLNQKPVDFEAKRRELIDSLQLADTITMSDTHFKGSRRFWKIPGLYPLMASFSYLRDRHQMNKMFYVSHSHKVIFVRVLKAGGTSVLAGFSKLMNSKLNVMALSDEQVDALGYYLRTTNLPGDYKKFAIVRDPYQRIVSVYLDLFDKSSPVFSYASYWFGILERDMSFKDFIKVISEIPISLLGPHFSPQSWILKDTSGVKVFRIKEDKKELMDFLQEYGIELQHRNKNRAEYDYRTYYDKETFALVRSLYADDVEQFGYKEEEAGLKDVLAL